MDDVVHEATRQIGRHEILARLKQIPPEHELRKYVTIIGTDVRLVRHGILALPLLADELGREGFGAFRSLLKSRVLQGCNDRGIPVPQMGFGVEEGGAGTPVI
ncbi:MAG TPA: hypothetical protein VMV69_30650 [Pirellulales bacterium]|nr:hypothetical protein [Pirellulales bacterium]